MHIITSIDVPGKRVLVVLNIVMVENVSLFNQ